MLNVLIADDEFFIRQRLKRIIDWDKLELRCVGEAENGQEVIDFITRHLVDILLLDIKMPVKSGMEVLEYIYEHGINTKVIFLSGYNDFEYAQKAIKCQAVNYLLKPIDKASLDSALISCRDNILSSLKSQEGIRKYNQYLRRSFIYKVATGGIDVCELFQAYPDFSSFRFCCFLGVYCYEGMKSCIEQFSKKISSQNIAFEYFQESEHVAILQFYLEEERDFEDIFALCNDFLDEFTGYLFLSLGEAFPIQSVWATQYQMVLEDLVKRYFYDGKKLVRQKNSEIYKIDKKTFLSLRQNIVLYLNAKDKENLEKLLDHLFDDIRKTGNPHQLSLIVTEILIIYSVNSHQVFLPAKNLNAFAWELIDEGYSLQALVEVIVSYGVQCMEHIVTIPSDAVLVKKIRDYITKNCTNPELSVSKISEFFGLNSAYVGSVYKKVTGQSIVQSITALRMGKARELLNTRDYKIIQVAEMVGYSDVFYFSKKFKKFYGCSPRDYSNSEEM